MFVSIMCNMQACDIFQELSDRTNGEISKFTYYSIIWCMFYTKCHTIGEGRLTVCPRRQSVHFNISLLLSSVAGQFAVVQRCP